MLFHSAAVWHVHEEEPRTAAVPAPFAGRPASRQPGQAAARVRPRITQVRNNCSNGVINEFAPFSTFMIIHNMLKPAAYICNYF